MLAAVVDFVGGTETCEFLEDVLGNAGIKCAGAVKTEAVADLVLDCGGATKFLFVVGPVVVSIGG